MIRKILFTLFVLIGVPLSASCNFEQTTPTAQAGMPNPASVYCEQQGNRLEIVTAADGSQTGYCSFPNGNTCDEWAYYRGECDPDQSSVDELVIETFELKWQARS